MDGNRDDSGIDIPNMAHGNRSSHMGFPMKEAEITMKTGIIRPKLEKNGNDPFQIVVNRKTKQKTKQCNTIKTKVTTKQ